MSDSMDDQKQYVMFEPDSATRTVLMYTMQDTLNKYQMDYALQDSNRFSLMGEWQGDTLEVSFTRKDEDDFLLVNRGFHWINEYPFNR